MLKLLKKIKNYKKRNLNSFLKCEIEISHNELILKYKRYFWYTLFGIVSCLVLITPIYLMYLNGESFEIFGLVNLVLLIYLFTIWSQETAVVIFNKDDKTVVRYLWYKHIKKYNAKGCKLVSMIERDVYKGQTYCVNRYYLELRNGKRIRLVEMLHIHNKYESSELFKMSKKIITDISDWIDIPYQVNDRYSLTPSEKQKIMQRFR